MKKYCRTLIVSLIALSILFCLFVTVNAETNSSKTIFFDDFTFEIPNGESDLFVGHTGSGSLKTRDTQRGCYVLSKDPETDKATVDPAFKTPSFTAEAGLTVLEFSVSHTGAQSYTVQLYSNDAALVTLIDKETEKDRIDYKAIFDFENKSVSLYKNGELSTEFEITSENSLIGEELQFRFLGYHIKSLTAEVLFDYVNIYKYDSDAVFVENNENTDIGKINVQFFAPLIKNLDEEDIIIDGATINSITKKDGALNLFEIEFKEKLDFGAKYTLVLNSDCVIGDTEEIKSSFTTRERNFVVNAPEISTDALENGECTVSVDIDNETLMPKEVVLNISLYKGNKMVWTKFVPYTIPAEDSIGDEEDDYVNVTLSEIGEDSVMKMIVFDGIDSLYPYSPLVTVTEKEKTIEEVYAGDRNKSSSVSYEFDPDMLTINTEIKVSEQGMGKLFTGFMIEEKTAIKDIYLSNPEKIIYFTYDVLNEKINSIAFGIPNISDNYKFYYLSGDDSKLNFINMSIYSTTYIENALIDISNAAEPQALWSSLKTYANAFQIDVSDNFDENLYLSMLALKGSAFTTAKQLKDTFTKAGTLVNKNNSDIDELIKAVNEETPLASYELYTETLSEKAVEYVKGKLLEETTFTYEQLSIKFNFHVIMGGIYLAENYKQVQKIIEETTALTEIELDDYEDLSSEKKKSAVLSVLGNLYDSYEKLKKEFNSAVKTAGKKTSGGGGGGGSSGGKKVTKNTFDTPVSYTPVEKAVETASFSDMDGYEWAKEAVEHLVSVKAVSGKTAEKFYPQDFITREEAAKIIAVAFKLNKKTDFSIPFSDVNKDDWSMEYIAAVSSNGIINGIESTVYGKNVLLSRQMLVTMLYRIAELKNIEIEEKTKEFDDMNEVSEYALEAIGVLYGNSLINGVGDNLFSPERNCTRAEASKMISDFLKFCELKGK